MKRFIFIVLGLIGTGMVCAQKSDPFLWQKNNTTIKLGGYIRVSASADFDGTIDNNDFIVADIPVPGKWDKRGSLGIDASATRLSLNVTQKTTVGDIRFYIESDFRGGSSVLRLRQAYISFLGITAGQAWSFLYDPQAIAPPIDIQGDDSRTFFRTPLIGYTHKISKDFTVGASVEMPRTRITTATGVKSVTQRIPDVPLYLQYKTAYGHLKLGGVFRGLSYGDTKTEKIKTRFGWGVQLSGSLKPVSFLTLYAQGEYGEGIARYISDLAVLNVDLLPDSNEAGVMKTIPMCGISCGLRVDFSKKIYAAANYSTAILHREESYITGSDYRWGEYLSCSLFWNAFQNMTVATEYLYGHRKNMDDVSGHANRIQLMLKYDF
nr:DcaP family trimeric outer membrane transporter [Bacteroides intestinalis]